MSNKTMNKNNNFLYSMIIILAIAMGYFYINKTNSEFFQNLMNKISNDKLNWEDEKDEVIPQETPKDVKPTQPPKQEKDDLKIAPPSDEELLPQDDKPRKKR